MIDRLTFRQWSRCVDLGTAGIEMMHSRRAMRKAVQTVQRAVFRDTLAHGTGIYRTTMSMGEGCTPIKRIDPADFFAAPPDG